MMFLDMNDDAILTTADLFRDWKRFKAEEPENHGETFAAEMHEILMATINGRNDLDIVGMKPAEIEHIILTLRKSI